MQKSGQTGSYNVTGNVTLYAIWLHKPEQKSNTDSKGSWNAGWNEYVVGCNLDQNSYITRVHGSYEGGVWGMWTDRLFKFQIELLDINNNWIYKSIPNEGATTTFRSNFGKDRSGAGTFDFTVNGYYKIIILDVYSSTNGPKKWFGNWDGSLYGKLWVTVEYGIAP